MGTSAAHTRPVSKHLKASYESAGTGWLKCTKSTGAKAAAASDAAAVRVERVAVTGTRMLVCEERVPPAPQRSTCL